MKANHCMIDLETLGTDVDSVVLSIGGAAFDPFSNGAVSTFYSVISIGDSISRGLTTSQDTIDWWSRQEPEAQAVLKEAKESTNTLQEVLTDFSVWFTDNNLKYLWGNGAAFDNVVMDCCYKNVKMVPPWKYYDDMCYRTVKTLNPQILESERNGTYHNALDDALHQVQHLQKIFRQDTSE